MQNAETLHRGDRHWPEIGLNPNFLEIPPAHEQGQIRIHGFMGKIISGFKSLVSKIPHGQAKNKRVTVSVFLCTFEVIAVLLKKFHLCLHCHPTISPMGRPIGEKIKLKGGTSDVRSTSVFKNLPSGLRSDVSMSNQIMDP